MRPMIAGVLLLLAACGDRPAPRPPVDDDRCFAAGHNLAEHEHDEPWQVGTPERDRLDARLAATCRDHGWSEELIACFTDTEELEDYGACRALMTEDQHDHLEGAWSDPEIAGPDPEPTPDEGLCSGIEALIAAGYADGFESIKGEQTSDDSLAPTWAVTLPVAANCSLQKVGSFPATVDCPIAEDDNYDGMVGAYHALVELLDACTFPDDWTRSESAGVRTSMFSEEAWGDPDDMETQWGVDYGFAHLRVNLRRNDPAYPYRLGFSVTVAPR